MNPLDLTTTISTQYDRFANLRPFTKYSLCAIYNYCREKHRVSFTFGVDNITDQLYFEPFQTPPAPGRSLVASTTLDLFDLLQR